MYHAKTCIFTKPRFNADLLWAMGWAERGLEIGWDGLGNGLGLEMGWDGLENRLG